MARRVKCHINIADAVGFTVRGGLARFRKLLAVAGGHGLDGFGRGEDGGVAGAGVIRVAVSDDSAIDAAPDGIDVEIARRTIEAAGGWAKQVFGADHAMKYECSRAVRQIFDCQVLQLAASRVSCA